MTSMEKTGSMPSSLNRLKGSKVLPEVVVLAEASAGGSSMPIPGILMTIRFLTFSSRCSVEGRGLMVPVVAVITKARILTQSCSFG